MKTFNSHLISILLLILFQSESVAHTKSVSYSTWNIQEDQIILNFTVSSREITKLREDQINYPNLNDSLKSHLIQKIHSDQIKSEPLINVLNTEIGMTGLSLIFDTNQFEKYIFDMKIFFEEIPGHIHYARLNHHMGQMRTLVLNQNNHEIIIFSELNAVEEQEWFDSFKQYIGLGFTHILEGIDHLLFLLALLILCKSFKSLVFAATGFTIGHSLTLGLAASDIVIPQVNIIESLIGWTIILASIESINLPRHELRKIQSVVLLIVIAMILLSTLNINELKIGFILGLGMLTLAILKLGEEPDQAEKLRPILAIIFGTIHGFGFANILSEISLDRTNFLVSLLGFNIGVEIGQILVLVIMWGLMSFLATKILSNNMNKITGLVSSILCSIGLYWFLTRLMG